MSSQQSNPASEVYSKTITIKLSQASPASRSALATQLQKEIESISPELREKISTAEITLVM